jgi:hypothetical protein
MGTGKRSRRCSHSSCSIAAYSREKGASKTERKRAERMSTGVTWQNNIVNRSSSKRNWEGQFIPFSCSTGHKGLDWVVIQSSGTKSDVFKVQGPIWALRDSSRARLAIPPISNVHSWFTIINFDQQNIIDWKKIWMLSNLSKSCHCKLLNLDYMCTNLPSYYIKLSILHNFLTNMHPPIMILDQFART